LNGHIHDQHMWLLEDQFVDKIFEKDINQAERQRQANA
jgi:hypothetical protein